MANSLEGTIPSLLQGVSQQIPRERKPGQLGSQVNMLSDPVTSIRRRPGAVILNNSTGITAPLSGQLFTSYVERGTDGRHLVINTATGDWYLLGKNTGQVVNSGNHAYLLASIGATSIQTASVGGLTYILNTEQRPVITRDNTGKLNPNNSGFFRLITTVLAGKEWNITVTHNGGVISTSYTLPGNNDDPSKATSGRIIGLLVNGSASSVDGQTVAGIRSRVEAAGGTVEIDAAGTTIFINNLRDV